MGLPIGSITIWSGSTLDIPNGWTICDGNNGTINLLNRFVIGAGNNYNVGDTGGTKVSIIPAHSHTGAVTDTTSNHNHNFTGGDVTSSAFSLGPGATTFFGGSRALQTSQPNHTHSVTINSSGSVPINNELNLPPYFALVYIQKIF